MKQCTKCQKTYDDNLKFCPTCGAELLPVEDEQKDNKSQIAGQLKDTVTKVDAFISDKAKETLSDENIDKVKEQIKDKTKSKNFMRNLKFAVIGILLILIGYGAYSYFSPEKQVARVADDFANQLIYLSTHDPSELTDKDVDKVVKLFDPQYQEQAKRFFSDYLVPNRMVVKNEDIEYKIDKVVVSDNKAKVYVQLNRKLGDGTSAVSNIFLKKIDGTWYIVNFK